MSAYEIDLNTKKIPDNVKVWRLFPGKYYSLLNGFAEQSSVYLEMPGLDLPGGQYVRGDNTLKSRITRSRAIEKWLIDTALYEITEVGDTPPQEPPRDLESYNNVSVTEDFSQAISLIARLFGTAKRGDLVITPHASRTRMVRIGEINDDASDASTAFLGGRYRNERTAARKVRWFPAVYERRLPTELTLILRTQNTLIEVPRQFHEDIFDVTYGSYFSDGEFASRFATGSRHFDDQDNLDLGILLRIAASAASDYLHKREISVTTLEILSRTLPDEDKVSLSFDINSPGFLNAHARTLAPLLFSGLLALFTAGDANAQPPTRVQVVNSPAADERCIVDVNSALAATLKNMLFEEWRDHCLRASRLFESAHLRGSASARRMDPK